jgi:hypothetical protein
MDIGTGNIFVLVLLLLFFLSVCLHYLVAATAPFTRIVIGATAGILALAILIQMLT